MIRYSLKGIVLLLLSLIVLSCEALPMNFLKSQSWNIPENVQENTYTPLILLGVQVDRTGVWDSIEKETAALAPLYFWKHGCRVVTAADQPVYAAGINLREREFNSGWRIKRSLVLEVRIWDYKDAPALGVSVLEQNLPAAVGRVTALGEMSFSSSDTINRMLSKAIKDAVKQLVINKEQENDA
jgi:hypothetical protein